MKSISVILLFVLGVIATSFADVQRPYYDIRHADYLFLKFKADYNRHYKDYADMARHYMAFVRNLMKINELNEQSSTAIFAVNKFTDYTPEEMHQLNGIPSF